MKYWVNFPLIVLLSFHAAADSGLDILMQQESKAQLNEKMLQYQKSLDLSNSFLVQAYGQYRALGINDIAERVFFESFFAGEYLDTLKAFDSISKHGRKEALVDSIELYCLWKLELNHRFFKKWIQVSRKYNFSKTEVGFALDQVLGKKASKRLLDIGFFVDSSEKQNIKKISNQNLYINHVLFGYSHLKNGNKGLDALLQLDKKDPLIFPLARTIVVDFAGKGQLGDAAKILSDYMNPKIEASNNTEEISRFYLLMGRLLYQAKAFDAAWEYYSSIPDESSYYLSAQTEKMWISLVRSDYSRILGSYQTLKWDSIALKAYNPDIFVLGAMSNLRLCHFNDVKTAFDKFISVNKDFAKSIDENLRSNDPVQIDDNHFYLNQLVVAKNTLKLEDDRALILVGEKSSLYSLINTNKELQNIQGQIFLEKRQEWSNRKSLLEQSLRRMRFAKIEFLSTLRRYKDKLALVQKNEDKIKTVTSAIDKSDTLVFPYDGIIFGDELFNYYSKVEVLCMEGKK